ncbi:MAG: hypothetical protein WA705_31635 [Candidatus Ozemobacteraceae bacterium]
MKKLGRPKIKNKRVSLSTTIKKESLEYLEDCRIIDGVGYGENIDRAIEALKRELGKMP